MLWQFLTEVFPAFTNVSVMKKVPKGNRAFCCRLCPVLRALVSVILVASLAMEILPWGFAECVPAVPGGHSERTLCIGPLQVCEHGDSFVGVLFDLSVLLPGAPGLLTSTEALALVEQAVDFVPDGFRPAIDHPPQLSA